MNIRNPRNFLICLCFSMVLFVFLGGMILERDSFGEVSEATVSVKFHEAVISYKTEDYKKAVELYEEILRDGWTSGAVYYNLANSYFKQGQLGKAILNYERAKRLTPRDPDLVSNYRYALSQVKNSQTSFQEPSINRIINYYADYLSFDEVSILCLFLFFLTGVFYFLGLFLKWPVKRHLFWMLMSCFFLLFHGFILAYKTGQQKNLAIVLTDSSAKFEPLVDASTHFELPNGWKVKILKKEGDWIKVKRLDGKIGWIKSQDLEKV